MPGVILAHVEWDDLGNPNADTAITTHHYNYPITPAGPGDYNAFNIEFQVWLNAVRGDIANDIQVTRIRFWDVPVGPNPVLGPADEEIPVMITGTATDARLPPQVAMSVTERTLVRARWGRFYIPGWTVGALTLLGRWRSDLIAEIADATVTMYENMAGVNRGFVSYRRSDGTFQLVHTVQVDDVVDIIRRRRHSQTFDRQQRPIP